MHYFGGKKRLAKELRLYLKKFNSLYNAYLEPFVESTSVMKLLEFKIKEGYFNLPSGSELEHEYPHRRG